MSYALIAAALFGISAPLAKVLLLIGLTRTPAASGSLLRNLEGVFTALLAWFVQANRTATGIGTSRSYTRTRTRRTSITVIRTTEQPPIVWR